MKGETKDDGSLMSFFVVNKRFIIVIFVAPPITIVITIIIILNHELSRYSKRGDSRVLLHTYIYRKMGEYVCVTKKRRDTHVCGCMRGRACDMYVCMYLYIMCIHIYVYIYMHTQHS